MKTENPINYNAINEALSSQDYEKACREGLLEIGLEFVLQKFGDRLNVPEQVEQKNEFRRYSAAVALGRIIFLNRDAVKNGLEVANSITLFAEFKKTVSTKLSHPKISLDDEKLSSFMEKYLDEDFFDKSLTDEIKDNILQAQKFAYQNVLPNPTKEEKPHFFSNYD